jgi:chromosome condensin MukBEF ATPase and DNA-binding subunit MukB
MEPEPSTAAARTRIDARTTAWLIAQRERVRELELSQARLQGELSASERIERAAQRYADKLEGKLNEARKREASLARALGYVEAQRDQLAARLGEGRKTALPELVEIVPPARPAERSHAARKR